MARIWCTVKESCICILQEQESSAPNQQKPWPTCWAEACCAEGVDACSIAASDPVARLERLLPLLPAARTGRSLLPAAEQVLADALQPRTLDCAQRTLSAAIAALQGPASDVSASDHAPAVHMAHVVSGAAAVALNAGYAGEPCSSCE